MPTNLIRSAANILLQLSVFAAIMCVASDAVSGQYTISGNPSGSIGSQTVAVTISPAAEDMGKIGFTYVAAAVPGNLWFFYTPAGWTQWTSGDFPAYSSGVLSNTSLTPLSRMDLSSFSGSTILAGYGLSATDMVNRGTYAAVYVVGTSQPVLSGTASKGTWSAPSITAYSVGADGNYAAVLGTTTADSQGNFTLTLGSFPTGAVNVVASGGTYVSLYDATTKNATTSVSAFLPSVTGSVSGIAVTPLTAMVSQHSRQIIAGNGGTLSAGSALSSGRQVIETIFGLPSGSSATIPRFDVAAITAAPSAAQVGLILGGMDTLGNTLYPATPDVISNALSADVSDGILDGALGGTALTMNGAPIPTDIGTAKLIASSLAYASAYVSGVLPAYAASVVTTYKSSVIPVYVAQAIPAYRAGVAATFQANTAPMTANTLRPSSIGPYSCIGGATISYSNNRYSCSDGGIALYTAQTIQPYRANLITPYESAVVGSDVATGTVPVYTSVSDVHVFTAAERAAMNAASSTLPTGWNIPQGGLTQAQVDAYSVLNHNLQVWYSGNPFRMSF